MSYRTLPMNPLLWEEGELFRGRRCPCNGNANSCPMWKMMCYGWCACHDSGDKYKGKVPTQKTVESDSESESETTPKEKKTTYTPSRARVPRKKCTNKPKK